MVGRGVKNAPQSSAEDTVKISVKPLRKTFIQVFTGPQFLNRSFHVREALKATFVAFSVKIFSLF
jgi:hypothetical protein